MVCYGVEEERVRTKMITELVAEQGLCDTLPSAEPVEHETPWGWIAASGGAGAVVGALVATLVISIAAK